MVKSSPVFFHKFRARTTECASCLLNCKSLQRDFQTSQSRSKKKWWRDLHGKGGAAFEFAIIIENPSKRGGDEWGKFARVPGTRTFLSFYGQFRGCKKLFRSTRLEQLVVGRRICGKKKKKKQLQVEQEKKDFIFFFFFEKERKRDFDL